MSFGVDGLTDVHVEYLVCTHMASPQADFNGVDEGLNWGADTNGKLATVKFTAVIRKCALRERSRELEIDGSQPSVS